MQITSQSFTPRVYQSYSQQSFEPRSLDGSGNNPDQVTLGKAGTAFVRETPPAYADGISAPSGANRPSPREISNVIFHQDEGDKDKRDLSGMVWLWGQFLDHDITFTPNSGKPDFNISVPKGDPYFDPRGTGSQELPFARSNPHPGTGESTPREHTNEISTWIDASMVYGSDPHRAAALRSFDGGKLRTSEGDYMPYNTVGLPNDNPVRRPEESLFIAGDVRANENVALAAIHTVFLREHNRLAEEIAAKEPGLDDEAIYQKARKIVGAQVQAITYNEFLPAMMGEDSLPEYQGYRPEVDASITNTFATAAYRLGHSMIESKIWRNEVNGDETALGDLPIERAYFSPEALVNGGGLEPVLRGTADFRQEATDHKVVSGLRNFLFGKPGSGGLDLAALNIQRGRDHGLADFNATREAYGLPRYQDFSEITSNKEVAENLRTLYSSVDDIDPWVGMLCEDHVAGTSTGQTVKAVMVDQFTRLRDGDRFFYKNDPALADMVEDLDKTTLADIIRRNTDIDAELADNVFYGFRSGRDDDKAILA